MAGFWTLAPAIFQSWNFRMGKKLKKYFVGFRIDWLKTIFDVLIFWTTFGVFSASASIDAIPEIIVQKFTAPKQSLHDTRDQKKKGWKKKDLKLFQIYVLQNIMQSWSK